MSTKLRQAIEAINAGDQATGKRLLAQVLQADPRDENAWLWLAEVVAPDDLRIKCLQNVLKIDPDHAEGRRRLAQAQGQQTQSKERRLNRPMRVGLALLAVVGLVLLVGWIYASFIARPSDETATSDLEPTPTALRATPTSRQPTATASPTLTPTPDPALEPIEVELDPGIAQPTWRWGDIGLAPGSSGIRLADWDSDGDTELFVGHQSLVFAIEHVGGYEFRQTWSVPAGGGWGVDNIVGGRIDVLWVLQRDGVLLSYQPYSYQAQALGQLNVAPQLEGGEAQIAGAQVVDLFGNGAKELLVLMVSGDELTLLTYGLPDLRETWRYLVEDTLEDSGPLSFRVGQVDDDPVQEIVLNIGVVVDPSESAEQWTFDDGLRVFDLGDIDGDGLDEVVAGDRANLTAYDVDARAQKWQFEIDEALAVYLADVVGDSAPEILVGVRGFDFEIEVYDAQTQQWLWNVRSPAFGGVDGMAVGDADGDGGLDLIWGAGGTGSSEDELYLTPLTRHSPTFTFRDYDGPFRSVAMQLDEDDALELVLFAATTDSGYGGGTYFVLDSVTGARERDLTLEIDAGLDLRGASYHPLLANIDGDPEQELFLGIGENLYLLDHDGSRLLEQSFSTPLRPRWVGDVDGDAQLELVSVGDGRVNVHSLNTLAYEWQSPEPDTGAPSVDQDVVVADVDQDGQMELLFYELGSYLQAYDGQTRQLEWQLSDDQHVFGLAVADIDNDGALEIALIEDGWLAFYDALTLEPVHASSVVWGLYPGDLKFVQLLSTPHPQLVIAGDEQVAIFYHPFDQEPIQILDVARAAVTWVDLDRDHYMDLLVGHQLGVTRYEMNEKFVDVAPPVARLLTPVADADDVSLDAFVRVSFDEAIRPDTIITDNAQLLVGGSPTAIDLSYDDETHVLDLKPQFLLPPDSVITVWLEPNIQDLAGNSLDANLNGVGGELEDAYSWQFSMGSGVDEVGPTVGELVLSPNPALEGAPVAITARVDDSDPVAASTVRQVVYFLDAPEMGVPLAALDEQFDGREENVSGTIDTTGWQGERAIYVQAQDSAGNWGSPVAMTLTLQPESAANWPTFGHDAARTGYNPAQAAVQGYTLAWVTNLFALFGNEARPLEQVAAANNTVVANVNSESQTGGIIAFDARDGRELWRYELLDKDSINPAAIAQGRVYFQQANHTDDSYLIALDLFTGEEVWREPFLTQWSEHYAPVVADEKVFVQGGYLGGVYAFDAIRGQSLWSIDYKTDLELWGPVYSQNTIYTWVSGSFAAWEPVHGLKLWSLEFDDDRRSCAATVSGDTAYVIINQVALSGDLIAIDLQNEREKWRVSDLFFGTPAVADGEVYALNGAMLQVIDGESGDLLWSYEVEETLIGAPLLTAGDVYVASESHTWVVNRVTRELAWEVDRGGWLTVANDRLFIAQQDGVLAVYDAQPVNP